MAKRRNTAAVALGRLGGLKGGPARAQKLTPEQRSESARRAVLARWAQAKKTGKLRPFERAADEFITEHSKLLRLLAR